MNFRSILSKTSLKSSCSRKSLSHSEEISKLQGEIESLKESVDVLKITVDSRDAAIGTIAGEKEKLLIELKTAQRTQRNLHQQLVDERYIYSNEKEYLINEIKRLSQRRDFDIKASQNEDVKKNFGIFMQEYEDQTKRVNDELKTKNEIICNIGAKYMKIKSNKINLHKKIEKLLEQNKEICENIIHLLQENRKSVDDLLYDLMMSSTIPAHSKKYLNLLQVNASLHYENIQLKIFLSVKNSSEIMQRESNNEVKKFHESCTLVGKLGAGSKSEAKIRNWRESAADACCQRTSFTKLKLVTNDNSSTRFKNIHDKFATTFGNGLHRSASDSCIVNEIGK